MLPSFIGKDYNKQQAFMVSLFDNIIRQNWRSLESNIFHLSLINQDRLPNNKSRKSIFASPSFQIVKLRGTNKRDYKTIIASGQIRVNEVEIKFNDFDDLMNYYQNKLQEAENSMWFMIIFFFFHFVCFVCFEHK